MVTKLPKNYTPSAKAGIVAMSKSLAKEYAKKNIRVNCISPGFIDPKMNEIVAACKKNGLMPFNNFNRIHMVPPCNISEADTKLGLELLSKSLTDIGM